jgi:hypothetical protein
MLTARATFVVIALAGSCAAQVADHLECFKAADALRFRAIVDLESPRFGLAPGCSVSRAKLVCVPARKSLTALTDTSGAPLAGLPVTGPPIATASVCYKVRCPAPPIAGVEVTDQFGSRVIAGGRAAMLCTPATEGAGFCGNGVVDAGEDCEPGVLGAATCGTVGFASGSLACLPWCRFDVSGCLSIPRVCAFSGTPCMTDDDCGIPGVCHLNPTGADPMLAQPACFHRCTTATDCTASTFCFFSAELGGICVGCGPAGSEEDAKCSTDAICRHNDCTQFVGRATCQATGDPCEITDPCVAAQ